MTAPSAFGLLVPAVLALVAYLVAAWPSEGLQRYGVPALALGWLAHGLAIGLDLAGIGREPSGARFGFAPVMSVTVWLTVAVYAFESRLVPIRRLRQALAASGAVVVGLAMAYPGEVFVQHAAWAPLHWLLGIASYALFAAAVLHAALFSAADRRLRRPVGGPAKPAGVVGFTGLPLLRLERLTFNFVQAGFATLTATLIVGWWFTAVWRWDHKTVFSLLAWGVFAGLLIGRASFGWRGRKATHWVYAGAGLLLLAYAGSRFVLEVLLHRPVLG